MELREGVKLKPNNWTPPKISRHLVNPTFEPDSGGVYKDRSKKTLAMFQSNLQEREESPVHKKD